MVLILLWCLFFGGAAQADPDATRDAFDRLEEILELRIDDGLLRKEDLSPALLVSARPRYVDTEGWFGARAIEVLQNTKTTSAEVQSKLENAEQTDAPAALISVH